MKSTPHKQKSPTVQKTKESHAPALQINANQSPQVMQAWFGDQASLKILAKWKPAVKLELTKWLAFFNYQIQLLNFSRCRCQTQSPVTYTKQKRQHKNKMKTNKLYITVVNELELALLLSLEQLLSQSFPSQNQETSLPLQLASQNRQKRRKETGKLVSRQHCP